MKKIRLIYLSNKIFIYSLLITINFSNAQVCGRYKVEANYSDTSEKYKFTHIRNVAINNIGIETILFSQSLGHGNQLVFLPFNKSKPLVNEEFNSNSKNTNNLNINYPKIDANKMYTYNLNSGINLTEHLLENGTNESKSNEINLPSVFEYTNESGDIENFTIYSIQNGNGISAFFAKDKLKSKPYLFIYDYNNNAKFRKIDLSKVDPNLYNVPNIYTLCYRKNGNSTYAKFISISGVVQNDDFIYVFLGDRSRYFVMPVIIQKSDNKVIFKNDIEFNLKLYDKSIENAGIVDEMSYYNEGFYYLSSSKGFVSFSKNDAAESTTINLYDSNLKKLNSFYLNDILTTRINDLGKFLIVTGHTKKSGYIGFPNPKIIVIDKNSNKILYSKIIRKKNCTVNTLHIDKNDNVIISIGAETYYIRESESNFAPEIIIDKINGEGVFINDLFESNNNSDNGVIKHNNGSVEIKPNFPGGINNFYKFLGTNIMVENEDLKGVVYVSFMVEKDGTLSEFKIIKDIGNGAGDAVLRALKKSPRWSAGEQNGEKVRTLYSLPITFGGN